MQFEILSREIDIKKHLQELGVDSGGVGILAQKATTHLISIKNLHVGAANILKQDALSVGADLAVPRGTVIALTPTVDTLLIATTAQLHKLSKKELAQPFELKAVALKLQELLKVKRGAKVEIMGIINANNDSFFSGSRFEPNSAILAIEKMVADGASIIDIGAVSSAPNTQSVSKEEELRRLMPIFEAIKKAKLYKKVRFSIDSYEPIILEEAIKSGFDIVNDITGLANDTVASIAARNGARVVIMHMQGTPQTMQLSPCYESVLSDIYAFFEQQILKAHSFGIRDIVLDVGIGFGKTTQHNLMLIKHLEHFLPLGVPLLVGASRKSLINSISPSTPQERLAGTIALHLESIRNGAQIVRVHDVYEHAQAIKVYEALHNI